MPKNENPLLGNILFETSKEIDSMNKRTLSLLNDDTQINARFEKTGTVWTTQIKDVEKLMDSLNYDIHTIRKDLSEIIIYAEKIIIEFRNKSKQDKVDALRQRIEQSKFESFITKKRLLEILEIELNKNQN